MKCQHSVQKKSFSYESKRDLPLYIGNLPFTITLTQFDEFLGSNGITKENGLNETKLVLNSVGKARGLLY